MGSLKRMIIVAAAALAATTAAKAADLPDPPIIEAPQFIPEEIGGGWYLRGDIGVDFFSDPSVVYNNALRFSMEKLQPALAVGVGAGYEFNKWIRADLTADWRGTDFSGKTLCGGCVGTQFTQENAELSIFTGMANIYLQAGKFHGFTPYVGGGIGIAHLRLHEYVGHNPNGTSNTFRDKNKTNFAWNLTAGGSYDIWENLAVDANYRYLNFGDVNSGVDPNGFLPGNVAFDDLTAHEIRVGLRYYLN